jgi:hypothetical protein
MPSSLTPDQMHKLVVSLVTALIVGSHEDRKMLKEQEAWEQGMLRLFACSFACNNTTAIEGTEEAHRLCEELFETYYAVLDFSQERLKSHNDEIRDRFEQYYRATAWIGMPSDRNVQFHLNTIEGTIPIEAFLTMEAAFWSFAAPERELSSEAVNALAQEPMNGKFGVFLAVWNEAEQLIQRESTANPDTNDDLH